MVSEVVSWLIVDRNTHEIYEMKDLQPLSSLGDVFERYRDYSRKNSNLVLKVFVKEVRTVKEFVMRDEELEVAEVTINE